ncbi:hypothetical protein NDU88_003235 [Pleurodeles waltl]|uniref:Uncharacterized protein n=1 Tax=Pleurodeles waltl TaxID=8319 RepID=A0AAV7LGH6_PLEWA|nr:hypothetical protein NDU88_003235 [Pleurodeles waltl]
MDRVELQEGTAQAGIGPREWLEAHKMEGRSGSPLELLHSQRRKEGRRQRNRSCFKTRPTPVQRDQARKSALGAVASLRLAKVGDKESS